jgi:hypothetical protein
MWLISLYTIYIPTASTPHLSCQILILSYQILMLLKSAHKLVLSEVRFNSDIFPDDVTDRIVTLPYDSLRTRAPNARIPRCSVRNFHQHSRLASSTSISSLSATRL